MSKKYLLITGGAGFIGSHFIEHFINENPDYEIINIDLLTYSGSLSNLKNINSKRHHFIKGDIGDIEFLSKVFKKYSFQGVINFAAESHVDRSISTPEVFIQTNIIGAFNLLNLAKKQWLDSPYAPNEKHENSRFLQISTDEVYGSAQKGRYFHESSPCKPNSPYSASKASADMLVRSFNKTYGLKTVTTVSSNNYGPRQHEEKFIPTIIKGAVTESKIPIYGDGNNIRNWVYVEDNCRAIEIVFKKGKIGDTYNIAGRDEVTNIDLANLVCKKLDAIKPLKGSSYKNFIRFVDDRHGHDKRYLINCEKIKSLGWEPSTSLSKGILDTIAWYLKDD